MTARGLGEPAPMFRALSHAGPNYDFGAVAGRWILLAFLPPPGPERDDAVALIGDAQSTFADGSRLFYGVLPDTKSFEGLPHGAPFGWFADPAGELRSAYGAVGPDGELEPKWILIDPSMRIMDIRTLEAGAQVLSDLQRLGAPGDHAGAPLHAPVLIVPRIFEPAFCQELIAYYERIGGKPTGVMQVRGGRTVEVMNDMKRRRDAAIDDPALMNQARLRVERRLFPQVEKAFQFKPVQIERHIVACYSADDGGYFWPHRDDTTPATAHRQFAVTINLNAQAYRGGDLRFPEFGPATYRAPTGGAVVFACALLHEALPVTAGVRHAYLPFLYDAAGAEVRRKFLNSLAREPATSDA